MFHSARLIALALTSTLVFLPFSAQAQTVFTVGQKLSAQQIAALGQPKRVQIDDRSYQVLASRDGGNGLSATMLLDANGVVGQTAHEVVIANQPTAITRQKLSALTVDAVAVRYYDHMDTTLVRYPGLDQAISALAKIRAALPGAEVALPVSFSQPKLR